MSIWTHVLGVIRFDDGLMIESNGKQKVDLSNVFISSSFYSPNENCNMPNGSEGSIQYYIKEEDNTDGCSRQIVFYGDLRNFYNDDCPGIRKWWEGIPTLLGEDCWIRDAILSIDPEDGEPFILTNLDMKLKR